MRHRVRLFVLPFAHGPLDPPVEGSAFDVETDGGDDGARAAIKARLVEWKYTVRTISALAGAKTDGATYAATVVAPKSEPAK